MVGIFLTMREFYRLTDDPSTNKGTGTEPLVAAEAQDTQ